mmetsp:Transcript_97465/g.278707  ORF Transcript_97465/g.278707 Transcript_97465/m.278707 type:complete len:212 (+) Transcript_97465:1259-1894(+)
MVALRGRPQPRRVAGPLGGRYRLRADEVEQARHVRRIARVMDHVVEERPCSIRRSDGGRLARRAGPCEASRVGAVKLDLVNLCGGHEALFGEQVERVHSPLRAACAGLGAHAPVTDRDALQVNVECAALVLEEVKGRCRNIYSSIALTGHEEVARLELRVRLEKGAKELGVVGRRGRVVPVRTRTPVAVVAVAEPHARGRFPEEHIGHGAP